MNSSKEDYKELISLTKQYLAQEFQNQDLIVSELETYNYFKEYAIRNKSQPKKIDLKPEEIKPIPKPLVHSVVIPLKQIILTEQKSEIIETPIIKTIAPAEIKSEAISETPKDEPEKKRQFELEPIKAITPSDLSDIKQTVAGLFPNQIILDYIPQDAAQIIIISDHPEKQVQTFLNNFSKAIDLMLAPSKIISLNKFQATAHFPELKMVIQTTDNKITEQDGVSYLKVLDLPKFFKEPSLKAELWKLTNSKFLNG